MATVKDLRICAKGLGLKGYSSLTKSELEEFISKAGPAKAPEMEMVKAPETVKAPANEPAAPVEKKVRTKSTWNTFLSDYRVANNCSLKAAMGAKDAYAEFKAKQSAEKSE